MSTILSHELSREVISVYMQTAKLNVCMFFATSRCQRVFVPLQNALKWQISSCLALMNIADPTNLVRPVSPSLYDFQDVQFFCWFIRCCCGAPIVQGVFFCRRSLVNHHIATDIPKCSEFVSGALRWCMFSKLFPNLQISRIMFVYRSHRFILHN